MYDELNDEHVVLSDRELNIIHRIRQGRFPGVEYDPYPDLESTFGSKREISGFGSGFEPKRRFIPSKWEAKKIAKLVNAIRNGWIKDTDETEKESDELEEVYLLWDQDDAVKAPQLHLLPPPPQKLPGHVESYNPPEEFLPSQQELDTWEVLEPEERCVSVI